MQEFWDNMLFYKGSIVHFAPEAFHQHVDVAHAIQNRQQDRLRTDCGSDVIERGFHVRLLIGRNDEREFEPGHGEAAIRDSGWDSGKKRRRHPHRLEENYLEMRCVINEPSPNPGASYSRLLSSAMRRSR